MKLTQKQLRKVIDNVIKESTGEGWQQLQDVFLALEEAETAIDNLSVEDVSKAHMADLMNTLAGIQRKVDAMSRQMNKTGLPVR